MACDGNSSIDTQGVAQGWFERRLRRQTRLASKCVTRVTTWGFMEGK
jgi:hypothetical protein